MEQIGSSESEELQADIQTCHPEVQQYILALKAENFKLQKRIIKLEAQNLSAHNRIIAFEHDLKEREQHLGPASINIILAEPKLS